MFVETRAILSGLVMPWDRTKFIFILDRYMYIVGIRSCEHVYCFLGFAWISFFLLFRANLMKLAIFLFLGGGVSKSKKRPSDGLAVR